MPSSHERTSNSVPRNTGKRKTRSVSPPTVAIRKSRRLIEKAMEKLQISNEENETTGTSMTLYD